MGGVNSLTMKILKTILYILLAVVLVLILLGLAGKKNYDVSRTVAIDAPAVVVFPYLKSVKKQNAWGPWKRQDPEMKVSYEGEDGTVGFVSSWEGPKVGKGKQEIKSVGDDSVETELTFYAPWGEETSTGYAYVANTGKGSEVTWGIRGDNNFIGRIFSVFMNMDKGIGPMFEEGLDSLRAMVQSDISKAYDGYTIQIADHPATQYLVSHDTLKMSQIAAYFTQHLGAIAAALSKAGGQPAGAACGLYYTWNVQDSTSDMAVGFPVASPVSVPGTELISLKASKSLFIDYYGPYDQMGNAHHAMEDYIKATGVTVKEPVIEEYVTDPQKETDSSKWLTKIYYLLDQ